MEEEEHAFFGNAAKVVKYLCITYIICFSIEHVVFLVRDTYQIEDNNKYISKTTTKDKSTNINSSESTEEKIDKIKKEQLKNVDTQNDIAGAIILGVIFIGVLIFIMQIMRF